MKNCTLKQLKRIAEHKKLICYGYSDWLKEICNEEDILREIDFIIDDNPNLWDTKVTINGKNIDIRNLKYLSKYYKKENQIVITASYQEYLNKQVLDYCIKYKPQIVSCPSRADVNLTKFRNIFTKMKLRNIIVFRSGLNKYSEAWEYADNARALFEYMIREKLNEKYILVWAVKYPEKFKYLENIKNVKVISYDWETTNNICKAFKYQYYLYCAKYFFFTETCYWLRYSRKEQIVVNLWHGCGIKARKAKTEPTGPHYNFMTVNSPLYAKIHAQEYGCKMEQMLVTGLPKQDWLFSAPEKSICDILELPVCKKCIFWLPTFRRAQAGFDSLNEKKLIGDTGLPILRTEKQMQELDELLKKLDSNLVIKLHPIQDDVRVHEKKFSNIFFLDNEKMKQIDYPINSLLACADALISDYSSAAIDYMLLDRPIAFTLDDLDEYGDGRGFNFDNIHDFLPGIEIYGIDSLREFFSDISKGVDKGKEKRRALMNVLHLYNDGNNCRRILEYFHIN